MGFLDFSKWEVKKSFSRRMLFSFVILFLSFIAIFFVYRPRTGSNVVLQDFYDVGMQDTPDLRRIGTILDKSPFIKVIYAKTPCVYFYESNGKISAEISGNPKSLITFYHIVDSIKQYSSDFLNYDDYILEPILVNLKNIQLGVEISNNTINEESLSPSSLPSFEPFSNLTQLIFLLLPIVLFASMFSLSIMSEKIKNRITPLLLTPHSKRAILFGKALPYLLFSLGSSFFMSFFYANWMEVFIILGFVNMCFFSLSFFLPVISRSFKEYSFLSTFSFFSFFFFLIFPNVMYGVSGASFLSPLSLLNDVCIGKIVGFFSIVFSFIPFIWLSISFLSLSYVLFEEEIFLSKKGFFYKLQRGFSEIRSLLPSSLSLIVNVFLVIPFIYFIEIIISMLFAVFPSNYGIFLVIPSFAFLEEGFKIIPFLKEKTKLIMGTMAGFFFFVFEKGVNVFFFINSIEELSFYSKYVSNIWLTLFMHMLTTTILFSKHKKIAYIFATAIHILFNYMILGVFSFV